MTHKLRQLKCYFLGHPAFEDKQHFGLSKQIACTRCGKLFGYHTELDILLPWDDELEHYSQMRIPRP